MPNWEAIYNWTPHVWWTVLVMVYLIYKLRKRLMTAERKLLELSKKQTVLLKALASAKAEQKEVQQETEQKQTEKQPKKLSLFDLDIQEEMSKGVKVMAKMKKDKGIIREIGLFKAGIILGLAYALFNLLREAWEKVKHHFDDEEGNAKEEDDLRLGWQAHPVKGLEEDLQIVLLFRLHL